MAVSWAVRKHKIGWFETADMAAPALALAYGILLARLSLCR